MDSPRVAIVTGARGGIGSHVVQRLLARGYRVTAVDRQEPDPRSLDERVADSGSLSNAVFDVSDRQRVEQCVSETLDRWGCLDALVTCAGLFAQTPIASIDVNAMRELLAVNLESVIYLSSAATRAMAKSRKGRMVHVSSIAAESGSALASVYAASKAGVVGLVKSHARELAPLGISVNAVLPGYCATPMLRPTQEFVERFVVPRIPMRRVAEAEEIAEVVEFLVTCKTDYLTGSAIVVDGGLHVG
jgi:3-oxoacyl-[acyl-carrier protein] reductase